jgi:hypothetical protein
MAALDDKITELQNSITAESATVQAAVDAISKVTAGEVTPAQLQALSDIQAKVDANNAALTAAIKTIG